MENTSVTPLSATVAVSIADVSNVGSGLSAHTVYNISIVHPSHPETKISHRYSEFLALHNCLKMALSGYLPELLKYEFPGKSAFKMNETLVAERKVALQKYLTFLSTNPILINSNFVKRFLSLPMLIPVENKNRFDEVWQFHQNRLQLIQLLNYEVNRVIPQDKIALFVPSAPLTFSQELSTKALQWGNPRILANLDRSGRPGNSAPAGHHGISAHAQNGISGMHGTNGTSGGDGGNGEHATPISVFFASDPQLQRLTVNDSANKQILSANEFELNSISLAANGGNGGAGGAGGNGGNGAPGRNGTDGIRGKNGNAHHHDGHDGFPGGPGGNGGNGGNAGHGGRGGNGGNAAAIQIFCHDPRTLLAAYPHLPKGGQGGRGGQGGAGGRGGEKGRGGHGGEGGHGADYQVTEPYFDIDAQGQRVERVRHVTKRGKNGHRGHNGPDGHDGSHGAGGAGGAGGHKGSDASLTFFVLDTNGGVIESATSIYHPKIVVVANDGDGDGVYSPGDTITFTVTMVMNDGGLTLPAGARVTKSDYKPFLTLPAIAPGERRLVQASYMIAVPAIPEPVTPGVFSATLKEEMTMDFEGKTFMSYYSEYRSQWPFKIDRVSHPSVLSPGDATEISVKIANITKYAYGAQSAVQVAIKLPQGLSLPVPPDSVNDMVQKWIINTNDDLACSFNVAMADNVFSPDESVKGRVELYWKGKLIEFSEFVIKAVPTWKTYLAGPPADVIIVHNSISETKQHMAWSKVTNHLNLTAYFWDTNYYPLDLFTEYISHPKCSRAVLVCALHQVPFDFLEKILLDHLQRNKTKEYVLINKDMTTIPIDGVCDVGGAITSFPLQCSDSRQWNMGGNHTWYDFKSPFAPTLSLPVISRLICSLPIFQKFVLLAQTLPELPCYGWTFEEVGITVIDIITRSLILDFVMSFNAKDFMAQRVVQKMLLQHSDFARNKQVVGAILLAIKRVDESISLFSSDKVWNNMKKCLMDLLALDADFKKECEAECNAISKRLKQVTGPLNAALDLKVAK